MIIRLSLGPSLCRIETRLNSWIEFRVEIRIKFRMKSLNSTGIQSAAAPEYADPAVFKPDGTF